MRRFLLISFLILCVIANANLLANNLPTKKNLAKSSSDRTITIGSENNASNDLPISGYYYYSYSQQIYLADEINSDSGIINAIEFNYFCNFNIVRHAKIYLTNTSANSLLDGCLPVSESDLVFDGVIEFSNQNDEWSKIELDTDFQYNAGTNIAVTIVANRGDLSSTWSSDGIFNTHSTSEKTRFFCWDDAAISIDQNNGMPFSNGTFLETNLVEQRPNIKFDFLSCSEVNNIFAYDITASDAKLTWTLDRPDIHLNYNIAVIPAAMLPAIWDNESFEALAESEGVVKYTNVEFQDANINITNQLLPSTDYVVYVQNICNCANPLSEWASTTFRTFSTCRELDNINFFESEIGPEFATFTIIGQPNQTFEYYCSQTYYTPNELNNLPSEQLSSSTNAQITINGLSPETNYYLYARGVCEGGDKSPWFTSNFSTIVECPLPYNLIISNITYDGMKISWHKHDYFPRETGYNLQLFRSSDNYQVYNENTTETNVIISDLEPNTEYRAELYLLGGNCETGMPVLQTSASTTGVPLSCLSVGEYNADNNSVPIYGHWADNFSRNQSIYPESMLTNIVGREVTSLTFNTISPMSTDVLLTGTFELRLGTTEKLVFDDNQFDNSLSNLYYTGNVFIPAGSSELRFDLNQPFVYSGGNLLLDIRVVAPGNYNDITFQVQQTEEITSLHGNYSGSFEAIGTGVGTLFNQHVLPVINFCNSVSCVPISHVDMSEIVYNSARVDWYGRVGDNYEIFISTEPITEENVNALTTATTVATNFVFDGLTEQTLYYAAIRRNCGEDGYSDLLTWDFITPERCGQVVDAVATDITSTTANLLVTASEYGSQDNLYNFRYKKQNTEEWIYVYNQPNGYVLTGLQSMTNYQFEVQVNCESGNFQSAWFNAGYFATGCGDYLPTPYVETFAYGSASMSCWTAIPVEGTGLSPSGQGYLVSYSQNFDNLNRELNSPLFAISENMQLKYKAYALEQAAPAEHFVLYINVQNGDNYDRTQLQEVTLSQADCYGNLGLDRLVDLSQYAGQTAYFTILHNNCKQVALLIDEFAIEQIPNCQVPQNIVVQTEGTTVTIDWSANASDTKWEIAIVSDDYMTFNNQEDFDDFSDYLADKIFTVTTKPYVIENYLTENTDYDIYMRTVCGEGEYSDWTLYYQEHHFRTGCNLNLLPFTQDYFHYGVSSQDGGCWDEQHVTQDLYSNNLDFFYDTDYIYTFNNSVNAGASTRIVTPKISTIGYEVQADFYIDQYQISSYSGTANLEDENVAFQYSYDGETWHTVQTIPFWVADNASSDKHFTIANTAFDNQPLIYFGWLITSAGSDTELRLKAPIEIKEKSPCYIPQNLNVTAESTNATLSWTGEAGYSYNIILQNSKTTEETQIDNVQATFAAGVCSYTISNLEQGKQYLAKIQTLCNDNQEGYWSDWVEFATTCDAITINEDNFYFNDFEDQNLDCWKPLNNINGNNANSWLIGNAFLHGRINGELALDAMGADDDIAILPKFYIASQNTYLSWYDIVESDSYPYAYKVLISNEEITAENYDELTAYLDINCTNTDLQQHSLSLDEFYGQEIFIAFYVYSAGAESYDFAIDDVKVYTLSSNTDIFAFEVEGILFDINAQTHTITGWAEYGFSEMYNSTNGYANVNIVVHEKANVTPESGSPFAWNGNGSEPLIYTVTAENADMQEWTVTVEELDCQTIMPDIALIEPTSISITANADMQYFVTEQIATTQQLTAGTYISLLAGENAILDKENDNTYYIYTRTQCNDFVFGAWKLDSIKTFPVCLAPSNFTAEETNALEITLSWQQPNCLIEETITTIENFSDQNLAFENTNMNGWNIENGKLKSNIEEIDNGIANFEVQLTLNMPAIISFDYQTSTEYDFDLFKFYINGNEITSSSGIMEDSFSQTLEPGTYTLAWTYEKDGSQNSNSDCVYIDNIVLQENKVYTEYEISRNGQIIRTVPYSETSFVDTDAQVGSNCYSIKTICKTGYESPASDEACVEISTCLPVLNPYVATYNRLLQVLPISWKRQGTETEWKFTYTTDDMNPEIPQQEYIFTENSPEISVSGNRISLNFTDIPTCGTYYFTLSPICDGMPGYAVDFSKDISNLIYSLPYSEDFDNVNSSFNCWTENSYPYVMEIGEHKSKTAIYIEGGTDAPFAYNLLPNIDVAGKENNLVINFNAAINKPDFYNKGGNFAFGYYSQSRSEFVPLETLQLNANQNFTEFTIHTDNFIFSNADRRNGIRFGFATTYGYPEQGYGVFIDDIVVNCIYETTFVQTICANDISQIATPNGNIIETADLQNVDSYEHTFETTSAEGCLQIEHVAITINQSYETEFSQTACGEFIWNDTTYTASGDYVQTLSSQTGCDSIVTLHLTINPAYDIELTEIACDEFTWNDTTYTESGNYVNTFVLESGCDSVVTLHLTVNHSDTVENERFACTPFTWNGQEIAETGTYTHESVNEAGCPRINILHATIQDNVTNDVYLNICDATSYTWLGRTYSASGDYTRTFRTVQNCDSVVTLHLRINEDVDTIWRDVVTCQPYTWAENLQTYSENGNYTVTYQGSRGCDSIIGIRLTINDYMESELSLTACESYNFFGEILTESGTYTHNLIGGSVLGCDSLITLQLAINHQVTYEISETACEQFTWNNETYTESGDYVQTFAAANGCDSVVTLHLVINQPVANEITEIACEQFIWNEQTYAESGDYVQTFILETGCDSVVILHLTINQPVVYEFVATTCDQSYEWNGELFTESGTYRQTFENQAQNGCDSLAVMNLYLGVGAISEFSETACDQFIWNEQTYTESGDYVQIFEQETSCDSVVTLHLTINNSVSFEFDTTVNDIFEWNDSIFTEAGDYTIVLQTAAGCDSVVTVHLTIGTTFVDSPIAHEISLYPNPTSDIVNIVAEQLITKIDIIAANGQHIATRIVNSAFVDYDFSNMKPGTYFVRIYFSDSEIVVRKVIKE